MEKCCKSCGCCQVPPGYKFKEKYKIKLEEVRGEPSDINWENLFIPKNERRIRSLIVFSVVSVFLIGSIVGTIAATNQQANMESKMKSCPDTIPDVL